MSPEQCRGEELSVASDIYSVGALGYYLVTGKALFPGRSPVQMIGAHVYEAPTLMLPAGERLDKQFSLRRRNRHRSYVR